jgi:hypothetical protein
MKLLKTRDQHRRDCWIDVECEACKAVETNLSAYDDRNYWDNVLPNMKCNNCGKSTIDLGLSTQHIATKYGEHEVV